MALLQATSLAQVFFICLITDIIIIIVMIIATS